MPPNGKRKRRRQTDSVFDEPSYRAASLSKPPETRGPGTDLDPSRVIGTVDRDRTNEPIDDEADRSVFDEPTFSEALAGPIPEHALRYATWYAERAAITTVPYSWFVTFCFACLSGPLAVLSTLLGGVIQGAPSGVGIFGVVVVGPIVEEIMKTLVLAVTLDRKPWLFRSRAQLLVVAMASGFAFAAIENVLYLKVYVPDPSPDLIAWRWTVCVALHVGCTTIASLGLAKAWKRSAHVRTRPNLESAAGMLIAAIVVHGCYNAFATVYSVFHPF